jgi:hypothetical protein
VTGEVEIMVRIIAAVAVMLLGACIDKDAIRCGQDGQCIDTSKPAWHAAPGGEVRSGGTTTTP